MGDPVGATKHVANTLAEGGTLMLVEGMICWLTMTVG